MCNARVFTVDQEPPESVRVVATTSPFLVRQRFGGWCWTDDPTDDEVRNENGDLMGASWDTLAEDGGGTFCAVTSTGLAADSDQVRGLYRERAHLIAALVRQADLDAVIAYNDPVEPELPVLYAHSPAGQLSWHLNPEHLALFTGVPVVAPDDPRARWDGHDKETALARLSKLSTE
ncbi:MAG: hypothetical protein J2P17_11715 [Mycobacterium sp.]|nr:hypothetical protein [Mycobacterium sp.]